MPKRCFDILASALGLLVLSPVFLVLAVLVWLSCGRPMFFRQKRVGREGREFVLYKFRSMTNALGKEDGSFDAGDASRVTGVGRFMRRSKLDELPQLWNVLKGDMSLVGPRPEVRRWVDAYPERWARIHSIRPGVTDPASIRYCREEELLAQAQDPETMYRDEILPHKLDLYQEYVERHSFCGDVLILFQTLVPSRMKKSVNEKDRSDG